jgi:hypothetical protein
MDLHEFMDDENFTEALDLVVKCMVKPDMPPAVARRALLLMQTYAFTFRMQAYKYMTIDKGKTGSDQFNKKNIYFSVSEQCHELAQTLKYIAKEYT